MGKQIKINQTDFDISCMKLALKLAKQAKDKTYPNPMVGAVIAKGARVIARGYHLKAGFDHAEVRAIKNSRGDLKGSTMFVTLEPCDHYGKTPPCTKAIIESGIRRVKIAMRDPNPITAGRGIKRLKKAGISVELGLCAEEAKELNRKYIKFITSKLPYVTMKLAQSIDGKIAARDGSSKWISSGVSRKYVKKIRSSFNAVIVGSNTVLKDDPLLLGEGKKGSGVFRVVIDTRLRIPLDSNILKTADKSPVIIGTTELSQKAKVEKLRGIKGVEVIVMKNKGGKVPLKAFLAALAKRGIVNVLIEGGGALAGSLMDEKLVDEVIFFVAPKILGGEFSSIRGKGASTINKAVDLCNVEVKKSGKDIFFSGIIKK